MSYRTETIMQGLLEALDNPNLASEDWDEQLDSEEEQDISSRPMFFNNGNSSYKARFNFKA
jgi:hypothetical protein